MPVALQSDVELLHRGDGHERARVVGNRMPVLSMIGLRVS
jgi:hypothetical protein